MCRRLADFAPDIVIGSNNPLEAQNEIGGFCRRRGIPFVFWLQDIHSDAIRSILGQRSRLMGTLLGSWYEHIERQLLRHSDHIVAISQDFIPKLHDWGIESDRITVVENWAPKDKIRIAAADNAWRRRNGLSGKKVALYTGTIGLKHNPDLLLQTAEALSAEPDVQVVVTSEGKYADYVQAEGARRGVRNLTVLPFQPFQHYGEVLATGDVLLAMIEPDAAAYSVPSKVLSYLCSGRPIVLSADERNLAAIILRRAAGGSVVDPRDPAQFIAQVRHFLCDEVASSRAGASGRAYAEHAFDVGSIADRFEHICERAARTA
jgi:glycosyltransferase involved in cell wall biosynthesis